MSVIAEDLSSTKGQENMDISDIEGSGSIEVVGEVWYGPETNGECDLQQI